MKPADVDFSSPSQPPPSVWLLLMAAGSCACALAFGAWQARRALSMAEATQVLQAAALAEPRPAVPALSPPPAYNASARQWLGERSAAWPHALRALENVQIVGVQVQSVEQGSADRLIRVEVTAPGHAAAVEFLSALNQGAQGHSGELQWVLARSVVGEGAAVRALLIGKLLP